MLDVNVCSLVSANKNWFSARNAKYLFCRHKQCDSIEKPVVFNMFRMRIACLIIYAFLLLILVRPYDVKNNQMPAFMIEWVWEKKKNAKRPKHSLKNADCALLSTNHKIYLLFIP